MGLRKGCLLVVEIYHMVFFGVPGIHSGHIIPGTQKGLHDLSFEGRTYTNGVFYSVD